MKEEKETVFEWIKANEEVLSEFNQEIWNYAEPAFREYKSSRAYVKLLREEGFDVEEGSGGMPSMIDPAIFTAGKTIGASIIELLSEPAELEKAQAEFRERTGDGIGGSEWMPPLLPRDFKPPVDLRWPEYITTERGEQWWIPTPGPEA